MLSLRRQKPVDIVEIALYILAIIPLTDAYDTCDVSGRLTVTGQCINKFDDGKCDEWASMGYCNGPNHQSMFIQCKRSCGFCISHDLYEEIPKTTCFPERTERFDMLVTAKLACGQDATCSGLIEAPKRRNQKKKFGIYSLTEREWMLCDYPVGTKATDDTIFFRKRGPSAACAPHGIMDLSSLTVMEENGWDLENIDKEIRLVLPKGGCNWKLLAAAETNPWYERGWKTSSISTSFWDHGIIELTFANCNEHGEVIVLVDGTEIEKSKANGEETTAIFKVNEGSNLTIATDKLGIIKLKKLNVKCGVSVTSLDARPSFEGYILHEDEYCYEKTYDNNSTTLTEAVEKCNNDPDCAAIEDRWGSGKPPIGLCKKFKGKRSGGGSILFRRVRCEQGWSMLGNVCYKFNLTEMDWNGAKSACNQVGAHLTSVHSQEEAAFIRALQDPNSVHKTWIGGQRNGNNFEWIDGTPFDFGYWNTGEPNNAGGSEYCIEIYSDPGQTIHDKWNDVPCDIMRNFVCQKQPVGGLDGAWGEWEEWTSCSQTCTNKVPGDIAKRTRNRSCSNPAPLYGGQECKGYFDDAELCNQDIPCENRLVIIGGDGNRHLSSTEFKNENYDFTCHIPSFPYGLGAHSSTVIPSGILVCGGGTKSYGIVNSCYQYKKSTSSWHSFPSMTTTRREFDMKYQNQGIWAIGGSDGSVSHTSMDFFDITRNFWVNQRIPINVKRHCLTKISNDKLILIAGEQGGQISSKTWTIDTKSKIWAQGPSMKTARSGHGCFSITENGLITKVVAMGGDSPHSSGWKRTATAEILDTQSMEWQNLPNLPFNVAHNKGVESVTGPYLGFTLGGWGDNGREKRMLGLRQQGHNNYRWEQVNGLTTGRYWHSVVNAPVSLVPFC